MGSSLHLTSQRIGCDKKTKKQRKRKNVDNYNTKHSHKRLVKRDRLQGPRDGYKNAQNRAKRTRGTIARMRLDIPTSHHYPITPHIRTLINRVEMAFETPTYRVRNKYRKQSEIDMKNTKTKYYHKALRKRNRIR